MMFENDRTNVSEHKIWVAPEVIELTQAVDSEELHPMGGGSDI